MGGGGEVGWVGGGVLTQRPMGVCRLLGCDGLQSFSQLPLTGDRGEPCMTECSRLCSNSH